MIEENYVKLIALYGAALSTGLLILQLYRIRVEQTERRPRIKVELSPGAITQGPRKSGIMIILVAANVGSRAVTLQLPSLLLPNGRKLVLLQPGGNVSFPHELLPGRSCTLWEDMKELAQSLLKEGCSGETKIVCEFRDAVGNSHKSKPFAFAVDYWAKE